MTSPLTIMSTLAVGLAFERTILPHWQVGGRRIDMIWNPTAVLLQKIREGARADALVLVAGSMNDLADAGIIRADTIRPVAQAAFGLGVRTGAPTPDISTPEAFRDVLLKARRIVYSRTGASGKYFARLIGDLGIEAAVNARALVIPEGFTGRHLLTGEADLAVQQISELMSVDGVTVLGPFPEPLQVTTDFAAGIFAEAAQPEQARAFLRHLTSRESVRAYAAGGLRSLVDLADETDVMIAGNGASV